MRLSVKDVVTDSKNDCDADFEIEYDSEGFVNLRFNEELICSMDIETMLGLCKNFIELEKL